MNSNRLLDFEDKSLQGLFSDSIHPMWVVDNDIQVIYEVNNAAEKTFGFKNVEITLQSVEKIILKKEQQKLLKLSFDTLSAQKQLKREISLIGKTGKLCYADAVVSRMLYQGNHALLVTLTDVSEKKLYRDMLEEAVDVESRLITKVQQLKDIAYFNLQLARKPLANILGLVNVLDQSAISDQTLLKTLAFLKESGNELDELIKGIDQQKDLMS